MKPYKCPVCEGKTNVAKGFYVDDPSRTKCRACIQGVVYAPTKESAPVEYVPMPYPVYPTYPRTFPSTIPGMIYWSVTSETKTNVSDPQTVVVNYTADSSDIIDGVLGKFNEAASRLGRG